MDGHPQAVHGGGWVFNHTVDFRFHRFTEISTISEVKRVQERGERFTMNGERNGSRVDSPIIGWHLRNPYARTLVMIWPVLRLQT